LPLSISDLNSELWIFKVQLGLDLRLKYVDKAYCIYSVFAYKNM